MITDQTRGEIRSVILSFDGTQETESILPVARVVATAAGATLDIIQFSEHPLPLSALQQRLAAGIKDQANVVFTESIARSVEDFVRIATSKPAPLIALPIRHKHANADSGLDPTAEQIMLGAKCPVLLVPTPAPQQWRLTTILLPQDGGNEDLYAFCPALHLALPGNVELFVLRIDTGKGPLPGALGMHDIKYDDQPQYGWQEEMEDARDLIKIFCGSPVKMQPRVFFKAGEVGKTIVEVVKEQRVDLVELGWHGSLAPGRAMALKHVIQNTPSPILAVPLAQAQSA